MTVRTIVAYITAITGSSSLAQLAGLRFDRTPADSLLTTITDCYTSILLAFTESNIFILCTEFRCYNRYKVLYPEATTTHNFKQEVC